MLGQLMLFCVVAVASPRDCTTAEEAHTSSLVFASNAEADDLAAAAVPASSALVPVGSLISSESAGSIIITVQAEALYPCSGNNVVVSHAYTSAAANTDVNRSSEAATGAATVQTEAKCMHRSVSTALSLPRDTVDMPDAGVTDTLCVSAALCMDRASAVGALTADANSLAQDKTVRQSPSYLCLPAAANAVQEATADESPAVDLMVMGGSGSASDSWHHGTSPGGALILPDADSCNASHGHIYRQHAVEGAAPALLGSTDTHVSSTEQGALVAWQSHGPEASMAQQQDCHGLLQQSGAVGDQELDCSPQVETRQSEILELLDACAVPESLKELIVADEQVFVYKSDVLLLSVCNGIKDFDA